MFVDVKTAAWIDRAEGALCAGLARSKKEVSLVLSIAGGSAVYVAPRSPINKVIGLGFDGTIDENELAAVEDAWRQRNEPVRIELCSLTDPQIVQMLCQRGYVMQGFENQLGRRLGDLKPDDHAAVWITAPSSESELKDWKRILAVAFTSMDGTGSVVDEVMDLEALEKIMTEMTSAPGFRRYLASLDGRPVGSGSVRFDGKLAQMCGAGTLPQFRGRGVQKALLQQRLCDAQSAGCELAVVTTAPGSRSQENMMKRGFALLYARAILIKSWIGRASTPNQGRNRRPPIRALLEHGPAGRRRFDCRRIRQRLRGPNIADAMMATMMSSRMGT
jgi:ribosomal protein S18 acetylase RimI-like enzyme